MRHKAKSLFHFLHIRKALFAFGLLSAIIGCKSVQPSVQTIVSVKHDTLITKEIRKDSTIHNIYSRDTIFIRDSKLTIKYLYKGDSSAYLGGTVLPDTVVKLFRDTLIEKTVVKEVAKPKTAIEGFYEWFTILALIGISAYFGIKGLKPKL